MFTPFQTLLIIVLLFVSTAITHCQTIDIKPRYHKTWDDWKATGVRIKTQVSNIWDKWQYEIETKKGSIVTRGKDKNWDAWEIDNTLLKTRSANDWDNWEVYGERTYLKIKTKTPNDFTRWETYGDAKVYITTNNAANWEEWHISGDLSQLSPSARAAIFFIPIFVSSIHNKGTNKIM